MVTPNFWFGMFSMFSAAFLYEKFIYLLYNIVFTSVPIMWFALFDFQYKRDVFLKDPKKYQIGLRKECFGTKVFWFWLSYGAFQALILTIFCIYSVELNNSSFFKSGALALGAVCMMVNIQIVF